MDSTFNRQIEMMEREGVDPAVLRAAIDTQTERKARFGVAVMLGLMLGLGVVSLTAPQDRETLQAGSAPAGMADRAVAEDAAILWFDAAEAQPAAATRGAGLIRVAGDDGTR